MIAPGCRTPDGSIPAPAGFALRCRPGGWPVCTISCLFVPIDSRGVRFPGSARC